MKKKYIKSFYLTNFILKIFELNGEQIGCISKKWNWDVIEDFLYIDSFDIKFPMDLSVSIKALILGAAVLIVSNCFLFYLNYLVSKGIFYFIFRIICTTRDGEFHNVIAYTLGW